MSNISFPSSNLAWNFSGSILPSFNACKIENGSQGRLPVVRHGSSWSRIFSRHFTCVLSVKSQPVSKSTAYESWWWFFSVTSCAPNAFSSVFVESSTCDSTPMWNNDWISCSGFCLRISGCGATGDQNWSWLSVEPGAADPDAAPSAEAAGGSDWISAEPPVETTKGSALPSASANKSSTDSPTLFHLCWVSLLRSFQVLLFPLLLGFSWG